MLPLIPVFMRGEEKDAQVDHVVIEDHPAATQSILRDHRVASRDLAKRVTVVLHTEDSHVLNYALKVLMDYLLHQLGFG